MKPAPQRRHYPTQRGAAGETFTKAQLQHHMRGGDGYFTTQLFYGTAEADRRAAVAAARLAALGVQQ